MKGGKNAFRNMRCPLLKWPGDAESVGLTLHDVNLLYTAKDRTEYTLANIQHSIDKNKPLDEATHALYFGPPKDAPQKKTLQQGAIEAAKAQRTSSLEAAKIEEQINQPIGVEALTQTVREQIATQKAKINPSGKVKGVANADAPKAMPVDEFDRAFPNSPKAKQP